MTHLNILVVDDDKDAGEAYCSILKPDGFACKLVTTAAEALIELSEEAPDVVLLNLRLGQGVIVEGILTSVRSNPRFDRTHTIVITSYPELAEPLSQLADLVFFNPVDLEQLKTLLVRFVSFETRFRGELFYDPVTGLFNEGYYFTRLGQAFERARRREGFIFGAQIFELTVEPVDKQRTNSMMRTKVLRRAAERLQKHLRTLDTVARLTGSTFVTLHEELKQPADIQVIVNRLAEVLQEPYPVEGRTYRASLHLGAAVHNPHFSQPDGVLQAAEKALEQTRLPGAQRVQIAAGD
jgi:diguanylate cyclase (GGDEF)-like protein